jgi:hypothetical protein
VTKVTAYRQTRAFLLNPELKPFDKAFLKIENMFHKPRADCVVNQYLANSLSTGTQIHNHNLHSQQTFIYAILEPCLSFARPRRLIIHSHKKNIRLRNPRAFPSLPPRALPSPPNQAFP